MCLENHVCSQHVVIFKLFVSNPSETLVNPEDLLSISYQNTFGAAYEYFLLFYCIVLI